MVENIILTLSRQRGWILDRIACDLKNLTGAEIYYAPQSRKEIWSLLKLKFIPRVKRLIFLHQNIFFDFIESGKLDSSTKKVVFFTHPSAVDNSYELKLKKLLLADKIIVCSSHMKNFLSNKIGDSMREKISVRLGGVDTSPFFDKGAGREPNSIILVSKYTARKNGDLLLETVKCSPSFFFTLHGKNWESYKYFDSLVRQQNFRYLEFDYNYSSDLFNATHTFLSLSQMEGAPMPALEALSSGCRIVLTDTGFAQDLSSITDAVIVIPVDSNASEVRDALLCAQTKAKPDSNLGMHYRYEDFLKEFLADV